MANAWHGIGYSLYVYALRSEVGSSLLLLLLLHFFIPCDNMLCYELTGSRVDGTIWLFNGPTTNNIFGANANVHLGSRRYPDKPLSITTFYYRKKNGSSTTQNINHVCF